MSLVKRGNVWWYEFVVDSVRYRGSTKLSNKKKARNIESAVRLDIINGRFGIDKSREPAPAFKEFYLEYVAYLKNRKEETHPRSIENAEQMLVRLSRFNPLVSARLNAIDDALINRFTTWHRSTKTPRGGKYSSGSINRALGTIQSVIRYAEKINRKNKQWVEFSCPDFSDYMTPERERQFVFTGALRDQFIGGLPEPCKTVAGFLLDTGMRISECCELTWDRVLFSATRNQMYIYVLRGKSKNAKRYILLTPEARAIIEKQRTVSRSNYVFVRLGERVDKSLWYKSPLSRHTVSHQFRARRLALGLPEDAVLHSTRHSFLTELGATGVDVFTLKELAGHASVATSERYIHPISDTLVAAMERFSANRQREKEASQAPLQVAATGDPTSLPTVSTTAGSMALALVGKS